MHGQSAKRYRIIEIDTLDPPFDDMSTARGINEFGHITGWSFENSSLTPHSLLWLPEAAYGLPQGLTNLTNLADQNDPTNRFGGGICLEINIDGIAIGSQELDSSSNVREAYVWDLSSPSHNFYSLGTLDGPQSTLRESVAEGISDTSPPVVVGGSTIDEMCPVLYKERGFRATLDGTNTLVSLNPPGGSDLSEAYAINTFGTQSTGESYTCGPTTFCENDYSATLWQSQSGIALNGITANAGSKGRGINNSGNIVGEGYDTPTGGCNLFALYWERASSQPSILGNTMPPGQAGEAHGANSVAIKVNLMPAILIATARLTAATWVFCSERGPPMNSAPSHPSALAAAVNPRRVGASRRKRKRRPCLSKRRLKPLASTARKHSWPVWRS